ncbi:MAG: patatin-like phospholipase family protein [Gemmatimonadota bacterium]|jgi:NTE family protein
MAERVVLVLGGGGVKGLAHVGAWRALAEAGVAVTEIIGTSIGALVGACLAGGADIALLEELARSLQRQDIVTLNRWAFLLNGISEVSVFHADAFRRYLADVLPVETFDDLSLPFSANAVHLETGRMEWFGAGGRTDVPLADAVYASCALPLFYPPADLGGELYVDGGVRDPLPIRRAADRGADLIIAVDVNSGEVKDSADVVSKGLVAIHHRVFDIMAYARRKAIIDAWSGPELVHVRPSLDGTSTFDFGRTAFFLDEGYRAMRDALAGRGLGTGRKAGGRSRAAGPG